MSISETGSQSVAPSTPLPPERITLLIAFALLTLLAIMTTIFGLPGLAMTALALVPVIFVVLLLITVGK